MSNQTQQIVNHAWNFADVLRDDGLSHMGYTQQITFLLFLKMADEFASPLYNRERMVPKDLDWQSLLRLDGEDLLLYYRRVRCQPWWGWDPKNASGFTLTAGRFPSRAAMAPRSTAKTASGSPPASTSGCRRTTSGQGFSCMMLMAAPHRQTDPAQAPPPRLEAP